MARSFNGTDQELRLGGDGGINAYPFTFSIWFQVADLTHVGTLIALADNTALYGYHRLLFRGDQAGDPIALQTITVTGGTAVLQNSSNSVSSADTWYHAAAVFESATVRRVFLSNTKTAAATTSITFDTDSNRISVGVLPRLTPGNWLNGKAAEAGVWSAALSDAEIESLSVGYAPISVRPQSLVGYWPLHGRAGTGNEEGWVSGELAHGGNPGLADHPRIIYPRRRVWVPKASAAATVPTLSNLSARLITATSAQPQIDYTF